MYNNKFIYLFMDENDYKNIMQYFPPVNYNINNLYQEAQYSYQLYNAKSPLKNPEPNQMYSPQILNDLKTLRILLNSNLSFERFVYEINKLVNAWGPISLNGRNILNNKFLELINKINEKEMKKKYLMEEAQEMAMEHNIKNLMNELSDISFKPTKPKLKDIKNFDLSSLKLSDSKSIKKKSITKKPSKYSNK